MARIRSIKPEFPQSESMGNVSREARLTFIMLWTLADDEGRLRGNSRMLASLLFPYDNDAADLIDGWLSQLEQEGCIVRYKNGKDSYMQLCNWLIHQKIDKPSKSKIAPFDESSRILANPRLRIKDQGEDQGSEERTDNTVVVPAAPAIDPDEDAKPTAGRMPMRETPPVSDDPAVILSVALRRQGVSANSAHPAVQAWAVKGVTVAQVTEAVAIAREAKGTETIPPNYLAPIIEKILNPPAARASSPRTTLHHLKFNPNDQDRSGDALAMAEGMRRNGISMPTSDEEIDL